MAYRSGSCCSKVFRLTWSRMRLLERLPAISSFLGRNAAAIVLVEGLEERLKSEVERRPDKSEFPFWD